MILSGELLQVINYFALWEGDLKKIKNKCAKNAINVPWMMEILSIQNWNVRICLENFGGK